MANSYETIRNIYFDEHKNRLDDFEIRGGAVLFKYIVDLQNI
jgi:hypothetical protein